MSESPLKLAIEWKKLFAQGERLIEAGDLDGALPVLKQALATIEHFDAIAKEDRRDSRIAETMERIGYVCHKQGMLKEAEALYREALEILKHYMLGFFTREKISQNLAQLLIETGREDEGQKLLAQFPQREEAPAACLVVPYEEQFLSWLSLQAKMMNGSAEAASLMAKFANVAKRSFGSKSPEWQAITEKYGYSGGDEADPAISLLSKEERFALLLPLAEDAVAYMEIAEEDQPHPLCFTGILGVKSNLHKAMGDIAQAKAIFKKKLDITAKCWGEGHIMTVETYEEYEKLCEECGEAVG